MFESFVTYVRQSHVRKFNFFGVCFLCCSIVAWYWSPAFLFMWALGVFFLALSLIELVRALRERLRRDV